MDTALDAAARAPEGPEGPEGREGREGAAATGTKRVAELIRVSPGAGPVRTDYRGEVQSELVRCGQTSAPMMINIDLQSIMQSLRTYSKGYPVTV